MRANFLRKSASGAVDWIVTVSGSLISIPLKVSNTEAVGSGWVLRVARSRLNFTSSAVNGCPLWNVTFGRRVNWYVVLSRFFQLSASIGFRLASGSRLTSGSYRSYVRGELWSVAIPSTVGGRSLTPVTSFCVLARFSPLAAAVGAACAGAVVAAAAD